MGKYIIADGVEVEENMLWRIVRYNVLRQEIEKVTFGKHPINPSRVDIVNTALAWIIKKIKQPNTPITKEEFVQQFEDKDQEFRKKNNLP